MTEVDFRRLTINEVNGRPALSSHDFAQLAPAVKFYVTAQAESGGCWERDSVSGGFRNRLAPLTSFSSFSAYVGGFFVIGCVSTMRPGEPD